MNVKQYLFHALNCKTASWGYGYNPDVLSWNSYSNLTSSNCSKHTSVVQGNKSSSSGWIAASGGTARSTINVTLTNTSFYYDVK